MDIYHSKKLKDFSLAMQLVGDVYSTPHKKNQKERNGQSESKSSDPKK